MPTSTSESLKNGAHMFTLSCSTRISVSIIVAFVARGLSNLPGNIFCYSAISSAGVVVILPGFTVCEWVKLFAFQIAKYRVI